ncbi:MULTISPECIES: N-acetylneuraminate synthase family protein [Sphingobacterium]|uniref:N-acetylneuraminate synthase family protein n=1 Tax=Sphingobacterium TaxID=28453 RepID=UPI0028B00945|nr:N-acetylneuraminate synthase family protein [Sphingobacterium multivorum]
MENFFNQLKNIVSKSETFDRIVIVGKGSSVKDIDRRTFHNAYVINLNDSERIFPGDLCIFYSRWVTKSLFESDFKASYYLTAKSTKNSDLGIDENRLLKVDFDVQSFESFDKLITDYNSTDFVLSDFLILSVLKISNLIAQIKGVKLKVYLLGFDFHVQDEVKTTDYSGHEREFKNILFATQKACFNILKKYINNLGTNEIIHVGGLDISDLSIESYNKQYSSTNKFDISLFDNRKAYLELLRKVKEENYVIAVAELTNNHLGDETRLRKMIRLAKEAGADMIKVQKRDVATFYSEEELRTPYTSPFGATLKDYREGVELNDYLFDVLIEECTEQQIVWFASILDYNSLKYMEKFDPILIKLPSTISNHKAYIKQAAQEYLGDVVVSTGFTDKAYEDFVLSTFLPGRNLFLLQCTSSYPAPPEACQLGVVRHYEELAVLNNMSELIPGYSSHDVGNIGCMMAVAAGAKMLEKHVKLGNVDWVHFDGVALDLLDGSFTDFVNDVRKAQIMTGSKTKQIHHQEHHKYKVNN